MATAAEKGDEQVLVFPNLVPSVRISLPYLLAPEHGNVWFADCDGNVLQFCEDAEYRSKRHRLLWLDYNRPEDSSAQVRFHSERYPPEGQPRPLPGEVAPEDVFLFADYFRSDTDATLDGLLDRWTVSVGTGYIRRRGGTWVSIVPCPVEAMYGLRFTPAPNCGAPPSGLCLDPSQGDKQIIVRREISLAHPGIQRVHFRGYFYDNVRGGSHWMGLSSSGDGGAVGISPVDPGCYCYLKTFDAAAPGEGSWVSTGIKRSKGWHLFAIEFKEDLAMVMVDKRCVCRMPDWRGLEIGSLWLGAAGIGSGLWGGVELLHIPLNRGLWEGLDPSAAGEVVDSVWIVPTEPLPSMEEPPEDVPEPPEIIEEIPELPGQIPEESPEQAKPRGKASRRSRGKRRSPSPARAVAGLQIDCWSVPDETALQRLDRIMDIFVEKLQEARVVLPENFARLEECAEPGHSSCYVYSFGTRRLHINTREGEGGRLTLVVRCGGGYLDFLDFAARHGRVEDLKLKRLSDSKGHGRIQLTSVMSHGTVRLAEPTGFNSTDRSRPSTGCANCQSASHEVHPAGLSSTDRSRPSTECANGQSALNEVQSQLGSSGSLKPSSSTI